MSDTDRFWAKVAKNDGCWVWTAARVHGNGYGQFWSGGRLVLAHRFSWALHYGTIPDGLCVLHRCDNRPCIRPDHLFLGDIRDNAIDMVQKGRHKSPRGARHPRAKLSAEIAADIRAAAAQGIGATALARRYGVHPKSIQKVIAGQSWAAREAAARKEGE